jgi:hypothetical protein
LGNEAELTEISLVPTLNNPKIPNHFPAKADAGGGGGGDQLN